MDVSNSEEKIEDTFMQDLEEDVYVQTDLFDKAEKKKNRVRAIKRIAAICGITVAAVAILLYIAIGIFFKFYMMPNTTVDGVEMSFDSFSELDRGVNNYINSYSLCICTADGKSYIINPADINMNITVSYGSDNIRDNQSLFLWPVMLNDRKDYAVKYEVDYDRDKLAKCIAGFDFMDKENMKKADNAYVVIEKGQAVIIPETQSTVIDHDVLIDGVEKALNNRAKHFNLLDNMCYIPAEIRSDDAGVVSTYNTLKGYLAMKITFQIDRVSFELTSEEFGDWIYYDEDKWQFDREKIKKYVAQMAEKYDTVDTDREFVTTDGRKLTQHGRKYGWRIDQEAEVEQIYEALNAHKTVTLVPEFSRTGAAYTGQGDIGNSYIEIDLSNQHVYMYVDGKLVTDTACVTGCTSDGHGTPDGIYSIVYKDYDTYLEGADYRSHVNYWMPFNGGIGLHDATWRSKFGGSIYRNGGSHGCVNLPLSKAGIIYNNAYAGMPVILYW